MYQIVFYVPSGHLELVKQAMFEAGAGKVGDYDHCAWQTLGQGQFRPLPGSRPFIGNALQEQSVEEFKVEMICQRVFIKQVLAALFLTHPYQTPAYSVIEILTWDDF